MPFIPHTDHDTQLMLQAIGVDDINSLFDEIPDELRCGKIMGVPTAISEYEVGRLMRRQADKDRVELNFLGAGAYEHHIPAAVWELTTRGEFYSAYTPYQAEASQGTLQVIYEYQTMMASLTGQDVSNASLYDGASALAEATLMAVRVNRASKSRRVLIPQSVHPHYAAVTKAITASQSIELVQIPYDPNSGQTDLAALRSHAGTDITAVIIPQPNVFGVLEQVDEFADWAADQGALGIALVNPISLGLLRPPGEWGREGVPIVCGEGQPLGVPLSSGGPYFGFLTCREALVRQLPGRLVGRTVDRDGKLGFTLTLQAREQHIRRSRATSNICTNQGLMVTAATIYMSLLGPQGLRRVAAESHAKTRGLAAAAAMIDGVEPAFTAPHFHEVVLRLPVRAGAVIEKMRRQGILAGIALSSWYPELENCLLVCATETKTDADLHTYVQALGQQIEASRAAS
ncbi:MAG: aminomethyl-transferring glycine dehydrogenase subunit GcvPA [Gammaproteobacteria bacterium]|nr:MAG: aminomethyl-transferring glycine dehydrogenase subunit GcvPA [Gammaproteobacteria bacterium]